MCVCVNPIDCTKPAFYYALHVFNGILIIHLAAICVLFPFLYYVQIYFGRDNRETKKNSAFFLIPLRGGAHKMLI